MNIAEYSIRKKTVTLVLTLIILFGGYYSYTGLGRFEDPEFTIKTAVVSTSYPGASPTEVEQEVTDVLETAIQQLAQLKNIRSESREGSSVIWVDIKDQYMKGDLPQVWDELRRKVGDAQALLPPGAETSQVNDDFGDVYGAFFALTGDGYTYREIKDYADMLRRELLLVPGVAKVSIWGDQTEAVYVELSRARMSRLGVSRQTALDALEARNLVASAGKVRAGTEYIRIDPTGLFTSVEEIGELLLSSGPAGSMVHLKDVAEVRRDYVEPAHWLMRYNGQSSLGLGVSTAPGGNVVEMGRAVRERIKELEPDRPVGLELADVYFQGELVSKAVNGFLINLAEALAIVTAVLLIFMGLRSGLLIGFILLQTVCLTFIVMGLFEINLQRISLGALILALGMLVDNAIVVTEGILIKMQRGMDSLRAASKTVEETMWPLFGATVVAILAFAAIGTSKNSAGEFCSSLFQVVLISLLASWVLAITVTPLLCDMFLCPKSGTIGQDPYGHHIFKFYRRVLRLCLRNRTITLGLLLGLLGLAVYGFGSVQQSFFPDSTLAKFHIDYWRPEGSHIDQTAKDMERIEKFLLQMDGVENVTSFVGQGALRFMLVYSPETPDSAYGQLLITVRDYRKIKGMLPKVRDYLAENFPDAEPKVKRFVFGPGGGAKIEARFNGPDPAVLRALSEQTKAVMRSDPLAKDIRDDWRQKVKVLRPAFSETRAEAAGINRQNLAQALKMSQSGISWGVYREKNKLLPIIFRPPANERADAGNIDDIQVWSPILGQYVPFSQVASGVNTAWEDPIIHRRDRKQTITVQCDPAVGNADPLFKRLRPAVEALDLPLGYALEWGGEFEDSHDAQDALFKPVPIFFLAMVVTVVLLFNALRQPLIIFLCLPLALIGVAAGLLITGLPMGFMAVLGVLSLAGMLIKNAIVLIDQVDIEIRQGKPKFAALLDSSVSRVRPVCMAAATTILGMIPLVFDAFFAAMAVTIMSGLAFATVLTLIVVPVLYALFFGIKPLPAK